MKEAKWLAEGDDPYKMVNFLGKRVSRRKAQLFSCACFRIATKRKLKKWEWGIIGVAERAADEQATPAEVQKAEKRSVGASGVAWVVLTKGWWEAVEAARVAGERNDETLQCALVRCLFGNPFRPVAIDRAWLTSTVTSLAAQIYESRDFGAMPVLADALQDAGCENPDILDHCRNPGPHARGCWVVDLILGKS
jgi:hypothetical protein